MHVKSVRIENVRGFSGGERAVDIDFTRKDGSLAGWTVVAGRNGAGKTTFLRAIALALAGPVAARTLTESFAGWVRRGSSAARVTVKFAYHESDRLQSGGRLPKAEIQASLRWHGRGNFDTEPFLLAEPPSPRNPKKSKGPWRGPWSENPDGFLVVGYGPFRRLTGHATDAQRLMVAPNHVSRLVSLFREDASLVECMQWLKDVYTRALEKKSESRELLSRLMALLDSGLLPEKMRVLKVDSEGLWVRQGKVELPLRQLSDGYRTAVALVLDIVRQMHACFGTLGFRRINERWVIDNPGVILIDEADVHLHVSWQQRIGFWLKERFPNVQFIVSTHSPFVCQAADPNGLIRLPAPGSKDVARHIVGDDYKRIVNGTPDDAVLTDLFGLETGYSPKAAAKRAEYARLRAKQLRGRASPRDQARLGALQLELPFGPRHDVELALLEVEEGVRSTREAD